MNIDLNDYKKTVIIRNVIIMGLTTLTGGILLFLIWWLSRELFAYDIESFEDMAAVWTFVSISATLLSIPLIILYMNAKRSVKEPKAWLAILIILINYLAFYSILGFYMEIKDKAYFKISNLSNTDIDLIKLKASTFEKEIFQLPKMKSRVISFQPHYIVHPNDDSVDIVDSVLIYITTGETTKMVILPEMMKGDCGSFQISPEFEIKN